MRSLCGGGGSATLRQHPKPLLLVSSSSSYLRPNPHALPLFPSNNQNNTTNHPSNKTTKQKQNDKTKTNRYGDEQHLDEALDKCFRIGRQGGLPRRMCPKLIGLREEMAPAEKGAQPAYTLVLEFEGLLDPQGWEERREKIQAFFGPGVVARIAVGEATPPTPGVRASKDERAGMRRAEVYLVVDGTGAGRTGGGGDSRPDALPPLMPGLKARQQ